MKALVVLTMIWLISTVCIWCLVHKAFSSLFYNSWQFVRWILLNGIMSVFKQLYKAYSTYNFLVISACNTSCIYDLEISRWSWWLESLNNHNSVLWSNQGRQPVYVPVMVVSVSRQLVILVQIVQGTLYTVHQTTPTLHS